MIAVSIVAPAVATSSSRLLRLINQAESGVMLAYSLSLELLRATLTLIAASLSRAMIASRWNGCQGEVVGVLRARQEEAAVALRARVQAIKKAMPLGP